MSTPRDDPARPGGDGSPVTGLRTRPVGRRALLVELDTTRDVEALHAELLRRRAGGRLPPVTEIVPAARTVLLDGVDSPEEWGAALAGWTIAPPARTDGPQVRVPVRFDGPDLAEVARLWGVSAGAVPGIVLGIGFRVAFCGFAPGFGYLTGLPAERHVPRRASPRTAVAAGSLGLAGGYAGVYPRSSPGGWQLIGTTDAVLWDPAREPAALFAPGVRVRFTDADADAGSDINAHIDAPDSAGGPYGAGSREAR